MVRPAFVESVIRDLDLGIRMYDGPNITVINGSNAVTKTMLANAFFGKTKADYQAGKIPHDIPVSPETKTGSAETVWGVTQDGEAIVALVTAGAHPPPANGFNSPVYDPNATSPEGEPLEFTANIGPVLAILPYTGTDPDPAVAKTHGDASKIVGAGSGNVRIAANATENALGWLAIEVDTTLKLVAAMRWA